jgi:hypothetical protein
MSFETEEQFRKTSREREPSREQKETKEGEADEEIKRAAAMERVDYLAKEVKQSRRQMQNIVLNMQQVMAAIRALRKELALTDRSDPASVAQDKQRIAELKKKIQGHQEEIRGMREDLVREQVEMLRDEGFAGAEEALRAKAEGVVEELIQRITDNK